MIAGASGKAAGVVAAQIGAAQGAIGALGEAWLAVGWVGVVAGAAQGRLCTAVQGAAIAVVVESVAELGQVAYGLGASPHAGSGSVADEYPVCAQIAVGSIARGA